MKQWQTMGLLLLFVCCKDLAFIQMKMGKDTIKINILAYIL